MEQTPFKEMRGKLFFVILLLTLASCSETVPPTRFGGEIFGTTYSIVIAKKAVPELIELQKAVEAKLQFIDATMSSWKDDSELSRFLAQPVGEWVQLSTDLMAVLHRSMQIYKETGGAFDPSLGPLIRLWGFQGEKIHSPPDATLVAAELQKIGFDKLELAGNKARRTAAIDINLSAVAKGYAVDLVAQLLRDKGLASFLVEIGGELITSGNRFGEDWRVGIEAPSGDGRSIEQLIYVQNSALATSGNYRNYFESGGKRYQHILDPTSGYPVDNGVISVSVLAADCASADAYATAFMLLGERALDIAPRLGVEVFLLIEKNGEMVSLATENFRALFAS